MLDSGFTEFGLMIPATGTKERPPYHSIRLYTHRPYQVVCFIKQPDPRQCIHHCTIMFNEWCDRIVYGHRMFTMIPVYQSIPLISFLHTCTIMCSSSIMVLWRSHDFIYATLSEHVTDANVPKMRPARTRGAETVIHVTMLAQSSTQSLNTT
jgi:hypothetical protein